MNRSTGNQSIDLPMNWNRLLQCRSWLGSDPVFCPLLRTVICSLLRSALALQSILLSQNQLHSPCVAAFGLFFWHWFSFCWKVFPSRAHTCHRLLSPLNMAAAISAESTFAVSSFVWVSSSVALRRLVSMPLLRWLCAHYKDRRYKRSKARVLIAKA